ncbi:mechanosensitive ion channel family protein [Pedobacter sp. Hv1]|uniref:mechanosensitive ion channel family protein n=1 Tax=Pedobacter sp. Hv1 TaxID=1740090 RepID=UPI0009EA2AF7|nr:mechanosensitive ion channel family protein [Pedobacter sp. Hv1]
MKLIKTILFLLLLHPVVNAQVKTDTLTTKKGYPVVLNRDTLFYVLNKFGSLSAKERAERTSGLLQKLEDNLTMVPDSIKVNIDGENAQLAFNDDVIVSISKADADSVATNVTDLAKSYRGKIVSSIQQYKSQNDITELLTRGALGLLILILLGTAIFLLNKYSNRIRNFFTKYLSSRLNGIKIKDYELVSKSGELLFLRRMFNVVKYIFILLIVYLTLPIIFRLFPWTKSWGDLLLNFILNPLHQILDKTIKFIPNLISIIVIYFVFHYINKLIKFLATEIEMGKLTINGFFPDWAKPTYNIVRFVLYAFMLVVIWPFIPGSDSDIFKGVSVFLGLLISLGSSTAIGNIVAGLVITYMRPFRLGDRVKIGDVTGDVIEKAFLVTRLRTIKNEIITIPNSAILNGNTLNYNVLAANEGLIVHTTVTIGYDNPWKTVHELLIQAALETDGINKDQKPFVLQTSLDDWYVSYQVNAYTNEPNRMAQIYSNLHQNIQDNFNKAGVEIMSPHYQTLRDGNEIAIPPSYRPKGYEVPGFNVANKAPKNET